MHSVLKSALVLFALSSALSLAQPQGEVVIRSRDGKTRMGRILSETSKGYLLSGPEGTTIVEFSTITEIRQLAPTSTAPTATASIAPPPMPPVTTPMTPPIRENTATLVPPPSPAIVEVAPSEPTPVVDARKGFHFGIGTGVMALPIGILGQAQAHFDFTFGRTGYRVSANFGMQGVFERTYVTGSIDNIFQIKIAGVYSVGVGFQIGLAMSPPRVHLYLSPVLQPVILKFGDRAQHQVSLTASIVALSTRYENGYSGETSSYAGVPQAFVGYSYLF